MASLAEVGKNESVPARGNAGEIVTGAHLSVGHSLRDVLNHPAFAGHGRLILPWDDRAYDEDMRLSNIGSLLPYHSHVRPDVVVGALNHMIEDVNSGIRDPSVQAIRRGKLRQIGSGEKLADVSGTIEPRFATR